MKEKKSYGFVRPKIEQDHYLAGSLPKIVLQADGQWDAFLPVYEPQYGGGWDTDGCTVWGTQNAIEAFVKKIAGREDNYSERYTYILAGIRPPGGDPHTVAETVRKSGLIPQDSLPMTSDFAAFVKPDPMTKNYLSQGQNWLSAFDFAHEWVISKPIKTKDRVALLKEYLQYSPLAVSVTAWYQDGGVYVDRGQPNCHWCLCYGWDDTKNAWKIFDSYDQSKKLYSFDANIEFAKRYSLTIKNKEEQVSKIKAILGFLLRLLGFMEAHPDAKPSDIVPQAPQPQPQPITAPKYDWDTPVLARHSVRVICDEEGLTVEQKDTLCATIGGESGWKTDIIHPNYVIKNGKKVVASTDYGICQWNDYYHGKEITPDEAIHNPEKAVRLMCAYWKRGQRNAWIAYKNGSYKKYL